MNTHPLQHAGAILVSSTFISFLADWSPVVTWAVGTLALVWYGVLFYDRFVNKKKGLPD